MNPKVSRTIKIGVTGPSQINDKEFVNEKVKEILSNMDSELSSTPYQLIVISALARGADRILSQSIIDFKSSTKQSNPLLEIISQEDLTDVEESELTELIDLSHSRRTLNDVLNEDIYQGLSDDYVHAGQVIVDRCDCLIAVWNEEQSKKGHTSSIINYAQLNSIPVFIINPDKIKVVEHHTDSFWDDLNYLNIYNEEKVDSGEIEVEINKKEDLLNLMDLSNDEKNSIKNNIITPLAKANLLAMHYQRWHYWSINMVYYFSAGAVAIVALQLLFFPEIPQILILEALMMISILLLYSWNKKRAWHRRWIDYRYLAERLRAATIFAISGLDCNVLEHLPHQRSGDDWTLHAYNSIYEKQMENPCKKLDFEEKKEFVLHNWIQNQENYYLNKSAQHKKTENHLNKVIFISFALTALFAILHSLGVFWHVLEIPAIAETMTMLVIVLPAIAAACAGIKVQHEYLRISKRYSQMALYLKTVQYNIHKLNSNEEDKLVDLLEDANKMMLREHQDWRAIFSVRDAELP